MKSVELDTMKAVHQKVMDRKATTPVVGFKLAYARKLVEAVMAFYGFTVFEALHSEVWRTIREGRNDDQAIIVAAGWEIYESETSDQESIEA
jgi:hypothetical protein